MESNSTAPSTGGTKVFVKVWLWLLALTVTLFIIEFNVPASAFKTLLMVVCALMKAFLIVGYFMHMKYEKISLVYTVLLPLILLLGLVYAMANEGTAWLNSDVYKVVSGQ